MAVDCNAVIAWLSLPINCAVAVLRPLQAAYTSREGRMFSCEISKRHTRADVREQASLPKSAEGGPWDTGSVEHNGEFVIFADMGTAHDYANRWKMVPSDVFTPTAPSSHGEASSDCSS